jgi:glycine/D-amino acid oxidase-like deaminating enzyme
MRPLRMGRPFWLARRGAPALHAPKLIGHETADVAIIGGGITGCACAYLLAKHGVGVVLADAGEIGRGSTAASTALLMQEPDVDFRKLAGRCGRATAVEIWTQSRRAVHALVRTAGTLAIDADLTAAPSIYFARTLEDARELKREAQERARAGFPARWLTPEALRKKTSIDAAGAILTPGNAHVDPYRTCVGLARAARAEGAKLYARSRVRRIRTSAQGVRLELERGSIDASRVIVATGYATPEFKPLAGRFRMYTTYVITTPPLSARLRDRIGLPDVLLWDADRPYHYARWTPDHRLLFGGEDRRVRPGGGRRSAIRPTALALASQLAEMFPPLRDIQPAYVWEGLFATTPDGLPYIGPHRRYPKHLFALGYGGNGMTFGFLAAQILHRMLKGRATAADELFAFNRLS